MSDRPTASSSAQSEAFDGKMEWLYDTLDSTPAQQGNRPRRGLPWGSLLLLFIGLLLLGAVAFLLLGPPLPGAVTPTATPTLTPTVALPTPQPTVTPFVLPTETPVTLPTPNGPFAVGDRVVISSAGYQGVRMRAGAGLSFLTRGVYYVGSTLFVLPPEDVTAPYPVPSDGYNWWRVRDDKDLNGWVAEVFLEPAPLLAPTPDATNPTTATLAP
ncbi:MAG: SH3 domain-containing protein [Caldilineales bacterium]